TTRGEMMVFRKGIFTKRFREDRRLKKAVHESPGRKLSFKVWTADCIGSLDSPSEREHKFIVCAVDLCTRWAEATRLKISQHCFGESVLIYGVSESYMY
ncbi:hypothetical protein CEXT_756781, partial [Caerostris extrusa]